MDFTEAYLTIVKASKERNTKELPAILSCLDFGDKECLEIGCGPLARLAINLSGFAKHITCLENYDETLKAAQQAVAKAGLEKKISIHLFKKTEQYKLPFDDNSFDIIYAAWLPHTLSTSPEFLDEITRVTRKYVLLLMPGINDDLVKMKSLVFPGEKEKREEYKRKISRYLKQKGMKVSYKEETLKLDFADEEEIKGVFYCFDFKNQDIGDKKKKVDAFLEKRVHNLKNSFYCIIGEK